MPISETFKSIINFKVLFFTFFFIIIFYSLFIESKNITYIHLKIPKIYNEISLENSIKSSHINLDEKNLPLLINFNSDINAYSLFNIKSNLKKLINDFNKKHEYKIDSIVFDYSHWHISGNKNNIFKLEINHSNNDLVFINNLKTYFESISTFNNLNIVQNKILSKKKYLDDKIIKVNQNIIFEKYKFQNLLMPYLKMLTSDFENSILDIPPTLKNDSPNISNFQHNYINNNEDIISFYKEIEKLYFKISTYQQKIRFLDSNLLLLENIKKSLDQLLKFTYVKGEIQDFDNVLITNKIKNSYYFIKLISSFIMTYILFFFMYLLFQKYKIKYHRLFKKP